MKIYLAGRYGRLEQFRELRSNLHELGHIVTSRWLDTNWSRNVDSGSSAAPEEHREKFALIDIQDVLSADCVINFTEEPDSTNGKRGGRHVEFGIALQAGKRLIVVGFRENLFHHHPSVEFFTDVQELLKVLGE